MGIWGPEDIRDSRGGMSIYNERVECRKRGDKEKKREESLWDRGIWFKNGLPSHGLGKVSIAEWFYSCCVKA